MINTRLLAKVNRLCTCFVCGAVRPAWEMEHYEKTGHAICAFNLGHRWQQAASGQIAAA